MWLRSSFGNICAGDSDLGLLIRREMAPRSDKISRDRTREFLAIVERLNKSAIPSEANASGSSIISSHGSNSSKTDGTRSTVSVHSEFNKRASKIGLGIYHTSQMLSKLALRKWWIVLLGF